ncbi:MAG: amphi-Trp domain-containing protein [Desulfohalobium sp.]
MSDDHSKRFDYESLQDTQSIAKYLRALIEALENKRLVFSSDDEEIVLTPEDIVKFAVKANKKNGKSKLSIKISWKDTTPHLGDTMNIER